MDVETETNRDWVKDVDTEIPSRLSLISGLAHKIKKSIIQNLDYIDMRGGGPVLRVFPY